MHYTQVASPNVTWEVAKKNDIGFDLVAFNNRFSITFDYFHEKRTGIFMHRRFLPDIIGLESNPWANVGAVRSKGFDGNFQYKDHLGNVNWTIRGNITYNKNTILERDEENNVYPYQYEKGYRIGQQRGLLKIITTFVIHQNKFGVKYNLVILNTRISMAMELLTMATV